MLWLSILAQLRAMQSRGGRNPFRNASMRIAQRGASAALTNAAAIAALDGWWALQATVANGTIAQQAAALAGFDFCMRVGRTAGATQTGVVSAAQALESIECTRFQGKVCTLSVWAKRGAQFSAAGNLLGLQLVTSTGADQTGAGAIAGTWTAQASTINATAALGTGWTRYAFTATIPAGCTQIGLIAAYTPVGTAGADDGFYLTGPQLNEGPVAAAFDARDVEEDLARCLRHLPAWTATTSPEHVCPGQALSGTLLYFDFLFVVEPRARPTGITTSAAGNFSAMDAAAASIVLTALSYSGRTGKKTGVLAASVAAGLVAGNATKLLCTTTPAQILFTGAEL